MTLSDYIQSIRTGSEFRDTFVHHQYLPPAKAVYGPQIALHREISKSLKHMGLEQLYSHQTDAINCLRHGKNVLVATPTASGKSLIYNIAVLEEILRNRDARALYLFPLKALEQDQIKNLRTMCKGIEGCDISAEIYDGDTNPMMRRKIRAKIPQILFTNPDMLHRGILAHHHNWEALFKNLLFVVLDEVHTYRGIFGSHLNQIIRRLKRICRHYGSSPRFIMCSATVSNPKDFGESLVEEELEVVSSVGSPSAGQHFLFLNPDRSANFSSAKLFATCLKKEFRTIAFTQSRKATELIHVWTSQLTPDLKQKVTSYRAGFRPEERREIEQRLAAGDLLGVVSTSALEMGIDIGYLDICLLVGYPGTIINTWQRGGRVGRSGRESAIILVAKPDALDQYFMKNPNALFERSFEAAVLDPHNPFVVESHLPCAASEIPITLKDQEYWPKALPSHLDKLEKQGHLVRTVEGDPAWFSSRNNPQLSVNIRSAGESYTIFEKGTGEAIGTIDGVRALKECHPGAIYLHRARQYEIDHLVLEKKDIVAHRSLHRYYTQTHSEKETEITRVTRTRPEAQFIVREGDLKVTEIIVGYEKRALPGQELMGVYSLDLPPQTFETIGFWIEIEPALKRFVEEKGHHFMGGIHAIEHATIGIFPLFALCDRNDIGGICYTHHNQVGKSAIFIYDAYPGGVGLARRGFEIVEELLKETMKLIKECECEDGCPSCIHSPKCGSGNKPLDKEAALLVLRGLLGDIPLPRLCELEMESDPVSPVEDRCIADRPTGPRVIYLDLETQKLAQDVGGWQNAHLMRVSVTVIFDSLENRFKTFYEEEMDDLLAFLEKADLIVGFNIKRFDYKVLSAYSTIDLSALPTFDILEDIFTRLSYRLGLDHLAKETLGLGKTADGLKAVEWFRQGEMERLTDYCTRDVTATRDLFLYGLDHGHLIYREKRSNERVRLLVDWELETLIKSRNR